MISGSQAKKAFENYYLDKILDDKTRKKEDYFKIDKDKFGSFKSKLLSLKEIVFISTFYTSKAEKTIKEYFNSINFKGNVTFLGEKKEFRECVFDGLIEDINKSNFIEIVNNVNFIKNHFYFSKQITEKRYKKNIDNRNYPYSSNIITRFNSMPKKIFFIFTLQPKYYTKSLFQYRKDYVKR